MEFFVDTNAAVSGDGSAARPYRTIGDAARIAQPGDVISVLPGVYREWVNPCRGGREDARITYRSTEIGGAVITGGEPLSDWTDVGGGLWQTRVDNAIFGDYNPYTTYVCGDWYFARTCRHTGCVFMGDEMLGEAVSLEECASGKPAASGWDPAGSERRWYTEQDGNETVIWVWLGGLDPRGKNMELAVRRNCFMPDREGLGYITVSGFTLCKAATTWAPPASFQDGLIGPHWSRGWIIEDCEVWGSRCVGISLGKYRDPDNDQYFFHKRVKSATQMERDAVCRGQAYGWSKETVGSHTVRRCHIHHCGQAGIAGRMGAVFSVIEDCHIHDICTDGQLGGAETAGIKIHAAIDVQIRRNRIHHCVLGLWLDWQAQGTRVCGNAFWDNCRPKDVPLGEGSMFSGDVFIEVSHGPTLVDHNLLLSPVSVILCTQGAAFVHNLFLGSFARVCSGTGDRYTPYHLPHRTEVAGFMSILHGDDRIYNNLFVQAQPVTDPARSPESEVYERVGTAPFDVFPRYEDWIKPFVGEWEDVRRDFPAHHTDKLPVWISGNAYFSGSAAAACEANGKVCGEAFVRIRETEGKLTLETDLYDALGNFRVPAVTGDVLGRAFEPEQRFENPDGSDLWLAGDFYADAPADDSHDLLPGPFAEAVRTVSIP